MVPGSGIGPQMPQAYMGGEGGQGGLHPAQIQQLQQMRQQQQFMQYQQQMAAAAAAAGRPSPVFTGVPAGGKMAGPASAGPDGSTAGSPGSAAGSNNTAEITPAGAGTAPLAMTPKPAGSAIVRLLHYAELVGQAGDQTLDLDFWKRLVSEFFTESGMLKFGVSNAQEQKQFDVPYQIVPRFYQAFFQSGVRRMQFNFENPREYFNVNNHYIDCTRCSITYWFRDGSVVNCACPTRVLFTPSLKIEWIDQRCMEYTELVSRSVLSSILSNSRDLGSGNSPASLLPPSKVTAFGVSSSVMRFLECSETISHMRDLMAFSADPSSGGPLKALESLARVLQSRGLQQSQAQGPNQKQNQAQNQGGQQKNENARQNHADQQASPTTQGQPPNGNGPDTMPSPAAFQHHARTASAAGTSASPRVSKRRRASVKSEVAGDSPKMKSSPSLAKK